MRRETDSWRAGIPPPLPLYDAEVEYLQSTGTQWINTNIAATENTRVNATLMTLSTGNKNWFGNVFANIYGFCFNSFNVNTIEYFFGNSGWFNATVPNIVGKIFTLDFSKYGVVIDGQTVATPSYTRFTQISPITIFIRSGGSAYINGRLYSFQIY